MDDLDRDALEYWAALRRPADGWGHHVTRDGRATHWHMLAMWNKYGKEATDAALDRHQSVKGPRP